MRDPKKDFRLAAVLAFIAIGAFIGLMWFGEQLRTQPSASRPTAATSQSEQNLAANSTIALAAKTHVDLTQSSRYAFVTDRERPQLAIFDAYTQQFIQRLTLQVTPQLAAIDRSNQAIWYAEQDSRQLFRLDLQTLTTRQIDVPVAISRLAVNTTGRWVAVASEQGSLIYDNRHDTMRALSTQGAVSFLFLSGGQSLYVAELTSGTLRQVDLDSEQETTVFSLQQPMSAISVMPNLMAFFFTANGRLYRYGLLDERLTHEDFPVLNERPYITAESRSVLVLSENDQAEPELLKINAYTQKILNRYPLPQLAANQEKIRTGWLEQFAVVATQQALHSINLAAKTSIDFPLSADIQDMLVQADSKALLATIQGSTQLLLLDLRTQQMTGLLETGLQMPHHVLMGQTATICH